jgi:hypothetical protein
MSKLTVRDKAKAAYRCSRSKFVSRSLKKHVKIISDSVNAPDLTFSDLTTSNYLPQLHEINSTNNVNCETRHLTQYQEIAESDLEDLESADDPESSGSLMVINCEEEIDSHISGGETDYALDSVLSSSSSSDEDSPEQEVLVEEMERRDVSEEDQALSTSLINWALKYNIRHNALTDLLHILSPHDSSLPKDARTLLKTRCSQDIQQMKDLYQQNREYTYFGLQKQIVEVLNVATEPIVEGDIIDLLINVDGLPLYKGSSKQFWPILCTVNVNDNVSKPFLVAIFCGNSKPTSAAVFFKDFIPELLLVKNDGIMWNSRHLIVRIKGFVCDCPARAFIKCTKGHTAYYGCERCDQKGVRLEVEKKIVFPELNARKRTDESFLNKLQQQYHHPEMNSPLLPLNIGMVSQIPLEYMHLVCLGAMKKLLLYWHEGKRNVKISAQLAGIISENLTAVASNVCCEFARKPRSLKELKHWKAAELRLFLCYLGPIVLRGRLNSNVYHHFMLLHVAVSLLANPETCHTHCDYAEKLLKRFVEELPDIYGEASLVYTMHSLIHVCDDVRRFGCLDSYSAFPFENALGALKRMLRSGRLPLQQLCRRLSELGIASYVFQSKAAFHPVLSARHWKGPTLGIEGDQYGKLAYGGFTYTVCGNNCYSLLDCGKVASIENFIDSSSDGIVLICRSFSVQEPFYTYPCSSDTLKVFRVSHLTDQHDYFPVTKINTKCMLIPRDNYFVAYPLLHGIVDM